MGDRSPLSKTYRAFGEAIDAAALDASAWQGVSCFLGAAFPGTHTSINIDDFTGGGASLSVSDGYDEDVLEEYVAYYSRINPWLPYFSSVPCLHSFTMDETGGFGSFRKTEFCDWLLQLGEMNHATGIKLLHDRSRAAMLAVHYGDAAAGRYNSELPRLLSENAIRLKRALDLNRIAEDKAIAARVADFVAQLPNPAFVLDGRCRIVEMNSAAEAQLTSGAQLRVTGSRVLRSRSGASAFRLVQAAAEIVAMEGPLSNGCDIAVLDGSKTTFALFPFSPKSLEGISCWTRRFALLLVRRATAGPQADVWLPYRFTATERRLSECIATGKSLRESADALGLTYETARTYLKSIFAKAGVRRQAELVALRNRAVEEHS